MSEVFFTKDLIMKKEERRENRNEREKAGEDLYRN